MTHKIASVRKNHMANMTKTMMVCPMKPDVERKAFAMVMVYSTSDSCACASDKAQRRR